jgi:hypothetical protein
MTQELKANRICQMAHPIRQLDPSAETGTNPAYDGRIVSAAQALA